MSLDTDPRFMPVEAWDDVPVLDITAPAPQIDGRAEIEALDLADIHLQHVARLRRHLAEQDELYRRAIGRLEDRHTDRRDVTLREIDWHLTPLRQLHDRLIEVDPKRKTIPLPHGDLKMTVPKKPQVFIDDPDAIVEWAVGSAPDLLPPPDRVKITDLRKVVHTECLPFDERAFVVVHTATGEIVPHVHAEIPAATWNADTEVGI